MTKCHIYQDYVTTTQDQSNSHRLLMTLVKYVNKRDADHPLNTLRDHYKVEIYCTSGILCGITLEWNYKDIYVDISIPGYITRRNSQNINAFGKDHLKIAHTQLLPRNMKKHQRSHPRRQRRNVSHRWLAAYFNMSRLLISNSSLH